MQKKATTIHRILPLILISLAGCFSLGRNPPPEQHFVLGGTRPETGAAARDSAPVTVGVRRLELAPYLATPFIVVRRGPHQVTYSEFERWGEDLSGGINRTVAGYLAARAPGASVEVAPWPVRMQHDYLIQLHVLRFEGRAPVAGLVGEAHLLATWEIIRPQDGAVAARGTTDYREGGWRVDDYSSLVALLDTGLGVLADDLAGGLEKLADVP